jgi:MinD superfamily P-loop ATPase
MSIVGIDEEKCTNCKQCIRECGRGYFYLDDEGQVLFNNTIGCNICGHCIAICPDNAIITKDLEDVETIDSNEKIVDSENLLKLLRSKRSIRRYKNKKVPKELIEKVFEAMRYAPSASNARLWRYVILSDQDKIQQLSDDGISICRKSSSTPSIIK